GRGGRDPRRPAGVLGRPGGVPARRPRGRPDGQATGPRVAPRAKAEPLTPRRRRAAGERAGDGGVAARRAVVRWAWRLFRREWGQQLLVLAPLPPAGAPTVFGVSATYNLVPSADARFGTATHRLELDRADRSRLDAQVAAIGALLGTVDGIGRRGGP